MNQRASNEKWTWVLHISAWLIYILLYATLWRDPGKEFSEALLSNLLLLPPKLILVYICLLFFVPKYLLKKKYSHFILSLISLSLFVAILNQAYLHFILKYAEPSEKFWDIEIISKRLTFLNSPLLVALTFEGIKLNIQLSQQKLNAELAFLKNQLQPHFFFNTLNNLYSLVLKKSDLAPDLILKLSDMMRYILYESNKGTVSLQAEVDFIMNFIAMEKIRYGKRVRVSNRILKSIPAVQFPPLLLFTFIENAFKHGVVHEIDEAWIEIDLDVVENSLVYTVKNSFPMTRSISKIETKEGIGLKNMQQRLELLYGSKFKYISKQTISSYESFLSIPL